MISYRRLLCPGKDTPLNLSQVFITFQWNHYWIISIPQSPQESQRIPENPTVPFKVSILIPTTFNKSLKIFKISGKCQRIHKSMLEIKWFWSWAHDECQPLEIRREYVCNAYYIVIFITSDRLRVQMQMTRTFMEGRPINVSSKLPHELHLGKDPDHLPLSWQTAIGWPSIMNPRWQWNWTTSPALYELPPWM